VIEVFGISLSPFWVGVFGAVGVEIAAFAGFYDEARHPEKYRKVGFYISKLLLALAGGFLVVVYGVTTAPAALQIGASASAMVLALSKRENGSAVPR
jgi:hypothetical protein